MPDKLLELEDLTLPGVNIPPDSKLPDELWLPILRHSCDFPPDIFEKVSVNLIQNPNVNSSLLFRADILYDSFQNELANTPISSQESHELLEKYNVGPESFKGFEVKRTIVRRMIPRNPQIDKPIPQTCLILKSSIPVDGCNRCVVVYMPHCQDGNELPWYHPRVKLLAYLHTWPLSTSHESKGEGEVSLHYQLFPGETLPLSDRLKRTGQHLLSALHKHGQGKLNGYTKRVHHDQIISQQRLQDTYTELKGKHAKRLCDKWVEKTEPSKHVFEDLGIAAFLIELWKDMYQLPSASRSPLQGTHVDRPFFPGFVDIGCGNGVLVDVLLREGYNGWGFDARKRKTWSIFSADTQSHLEERLLVPQPFFEIEEREDAYAGHANAGLLLPLSASPSSNATFGRKRSKFNLGQLAWHNGIFAANTFIISNHADELTAWTPLLASISDSPFLAIPCCSHNLSGSRFRAPSVYNNNSADTAAPSYFAANVNKCKSVAIAVASPDNNYGIEEQEQEDCGAQTTTISFDNSHSKLSGPEQGDLRSLSIKARAKQPSAYSSLCDWVAYLATKVGYEVEQEILRIPSTRNFGLICRRRVTPDKDPEAAMNLIIEIARQEKANGELWVNRAKSLIKGQSGDGEH